ncbi:MAG TPA: enoyl-CoA hydratase/isomerase family protein [Thermoleophilaceae bacterium]
MADAVRFERDGAVGVVTIDSPPLNLFDDDVFDGLTAALDQAAGESPRALLVRAEGDVFTGGVDVHVFEGKSVEEAAELFGDLVALAHRFEDLPFPTLASVHGLCLTAGFELTLACDMIWAAESARFGLVETVVGLTPGMGGTQRLVERAGPARARELVMTGGLYDPVTLERWNVVNRVVPDSDLAEKAMRFAQRLAAGPTVAHAATKRMARTASEHGVRAADDAVRDIVAPLFGTEDLQNAVRSFLNEGPGKATFEGR